MKGHGYSRLIARYELAFTTVRKKNDISFQITKWVEGRYADMGADRVLLMGHCMTPT